MVGQADRQHPWQRILPRLPAGIAAVGFAVTVTLAFQVFSSDRVIEGDLSTYLLPAKYAAEGWGTLYVDVFDLKPPLVFSVMVPWVGAAGWSLAGLWLLYAALLGLVGAAFWLLLRSMLGPWWALAAFASACLVLVGFGMLEEILFTTEVLGLALVLWAMWIGARAQRRWPLFVAGLLAGLAGQAKEVYLLAPLALIPLALRGQADARRRWGRVAALGGGLATALALTLAVLVLWGPGTVSAYLGILGFKSRRFPAPDASTLAERLAEAMGAVSQWLPLAIVTIGTALVLAIAARVRARAPGDPERGSAHDAVGMASVTLVVVVLAGLAWQGAPVVLHYAIALVFPAMLALAALIRWGRDAAVELELSRPLGIAASIALLAGLVPSAGALAWSAGRAISVDPVGVVAAATELERPGDLAVFSRISDLAGPGSCIQVAYGWTAPAYYLYADRPACSRFAVPPLALDASLRSEHQQALIERPPAVLVLDPALRGETALPEDEGTPETSIFPFEAVAETCYEPVSDAPLLYVPRGAPEVTASCIAARVAEMGSERALPGQRGVEGTALPAN